MLPVLSLRERYGIFAAMAQQHYEEVSDEELAGEIAIGMHTGLRKGSEAPDSAKLWQAIRESQDTSWSDAAKYCVWGLRQMGYKVTKAVES